MGGEVLFSLSLSEASLGIIRTRIRNQGCWFALSDYVALNFGRWLLCPVSTTP